MGGMTRRRLGRLAIGGAGAAAVSAAGAGAATAVSASRSWRTTGKAVSQLSSFDSTVKTFMRDRSITAGQLAVTYKGRLVLARGYTWSADSALSVQPTSLFRIASISKPVTATAIMKLVQDGKLSLDTPITKILTLTPPSGQSADSRLPAVTIRRLLQHLGGWDRDVSGDPMFADAAVAKTFGTSLPVTQSQIMRYETGRKLDYAPGTKYSYSNYGYLLLGRVIEKVSGMSYRSYVQQKVLSPMGIGRMKLGRSAKANRATGEVPYYSKYTGTTVLDGSGATVAAPYGSFNIENMDSHGGWLSTAVDLVRFGTIFDKTTVLSSASIGKMWAKPATGASSDGSWYGFGWSVRPVSGGTGRNTWHNGSLPGTYTLLVRTYSSMSWAILFDQRDDASGKSYDDIDAALWTAAGKVTSWPTGDQFPTYF